MYREETAVRTEVILIRSKPGTSRHGQKQIPAYNFGHTYITFTKHVAHVVC